MTGRSFTGMRNKLFLIQNVTETSRSLLIITTTVNPRLLHVNITLKSKIISNRICKLIFLIATVSRYSLPLFTFVIAQHH